MQLAGLGLGAASLMGGGGSFLSGFGGSGATIGDIGLAAKHGIPYKDIVLAGKHGIL